MSARLSHRRLDDLNQAILHLYQGFAPADLPVRFMETLSRVLPGNLVHISLTKPGIGAVDAFLDRPAHKELMELAGHRDELMQIPGVGDGSFYLAADRGPVSFHDFMEKSTLERTALWELFCKPLDLQWDMSVNFHRTRDLFYTISTSRSGRPYDAEERLMLTLLQPHFAQCFRQLAAAHPDHPLFHGDPSSLPPMPSTLVCDDRGRILSIGETSLALLRNCGVKHAGRIPNDWEIWLRRQLRGVDACSPPEPLILATSGGSLVCHCLRNPSTGQHRLVFQIFGSMVSGLSKREKEVAGWMADGKTNPEISIILGISRATVKNHVENILRKLGAENRTAAAAKLRGLS